MVNSKFLYVHEYTKALLYFTLIISEFPIDFLQKFVENIHKNSAGVVR